MWHLFYRSAGRRPALSADPAQLGGVEDTEAPENDPEVRAWDLVEAVNAVKRQAAETQATMEGLSDIMSLLAKEGKSDTPEFQEVLAQYKALSALAARATAMIQQAEARQQQRSREQRAQAPAYDFSGISPIDAPLGPPVAPDIIAEGPEIVNLQKFLAAMGYAVPESGEYDYETREAVLQFQASRQIEADGVVGPATRQAINDLLAS